MDEEKKIKKAESIASLLILAFWLGGTFLCGLIAGAIDTDEAVSFFTFVAAGLTGVAFYAMFFKLKHIANLVYKKINNG